MSAKRFVTIIKEVALEHKYKLTTGKKEFEFYLGKYNSAAFKVFVNSENYLQIHLWEEEAGKFGQAVYSLRNYTDVIHFCTIIVSSAGLRARRRS